MKKIYKNPTTDVVKIETTHMIALSKEGDTELTSGNLSRRGRRSAWDEEDEDEYDEEY